MIKFKRFKIISFIILLFSIFNLVLSFFMFFIIQYSYNKYLNYFERFGIVFLILIIPTIIILLSDLFYFYNTVTLTNEKISIKGFKKTKTYSWEDITSYSIGFVTCLKIDKKSIIFSTNKSSREFIRYKLKIEKKAINKNKKAIIQGLLIIFAIYFTIFITIYWLSKREESIKKYITWDESIKEVTSEEYYMDMNITKTLTQKLSIFPNNINNNADYYNSYMEVSGSQNYFIQETYLKYKYINLEFFNKEIYRLNNLEIYNIESNTNKKCLYIENMFDFPVYISVYNYDKCYEYALVDEMNLTIHYIHINNNNDFYIFDELYRPTKKLIYYYEHILYSMYE